MKWNGCAAPSDVSAPLAAADTPPETEAKSSSRNQLMKVFKQNLQKVGICTPPVCFEGRLNNANFNQILQGVFSHWASP